MTPQQTNEYLIAENTKILADIEQKTAAVVAKIDADMEYMIKDDVDYISGEIARARKCIKSIEGAGSIENAREDYILLMGHRERAAAKLEGISFWAVI